MTPEEEARLELYGRIFVKKEDMNEILDKHGDRVAEGVLKVLKPEMKGIHKEMETGRERFDKQDEKIQAIEVECAKREATELHNHHGTGGVNGSPTRTPRENYRIQPQDPEMITEEGIKKKTAAIIAVVTGVLVVLGIVVVGIIALAGKLGL